MMDPNAQLLGALQCPQVIEQLADLEHERWAHWQQYVHDQCERRLDGSLIIPADLASRWQRQIDAPYSDLSETEKESDREQVRRYLPVVAEVLSSCLEE